MTDDVEVGGSVGIGEAAPNMPLTIISPVNTTSIPILGVYTNNRSVGAQLHHYGLKAATTPADGVTGVLDASQKIQLDAKGTGKG